MKNTAMPIRVNSSRSESAIFETIFYDMMKNPFSHYKTVSMGRIDDGAICSIQQSVTSL